MKSTKHSEPFEPIGPIHRVSHTKKHALLFFNSDDIESLSYKF